MVITKEEWYDATQILFYNLHRRVEENDLDGALYYIECLFRVRNSIDPPDTNASDYGVC